MILIGVLFFIALAALAVIRHLADDDDEPTVARLVDGARGQAGRVVPFRTTVIHGSQSR